MSPSPEDELGINLPLVVGAPSDEQETIRTPQVAPVVVNPFDEGKFIFSSWKIVFYSVQSLNV